MSARPRPFDSPNGKAARRPGVAVMEEADHPAWCVRVDCGLTGVHESATVTAGDHAELVGVAVSRVRLGDGPDLVRVALTDDGATTVYSLPAGQATALSDAVTRLLAA